MVRYEDSMKQIKTSDANMGAPSSNTSVAAGGNLVGGPTPISTTVGGTGAPSSIPADLKVFCKLEASTSKTGTRANFGYVYTVLIFAGTPNVELCVQASLDTALIRTVAIFAEQVFDEESFVVHPNQPTNNLCILLAPNKHVSTNMLVKVLVSQKGSPQCQVFELVQVISIFLLHLFSKS